ncbi:MAG: hypothetical protein KJO79_08155 [Verrucomicrobiae bacterium]|nr:hypothetical protein [Verrucomicrobiae bacterium]NNJ87138.1 hypothetical protein [Akkermansiaceae bacterium]
MKHIDPRSSTGSGDSARGHHRPTFTIACWLLALIAFAQLITVGTALTVRKHRPAETARNSTPQVSTPLTPIQPRSLAEILASVENQPSSAGPRNYPADDIAAPTRIPAQQPATNFPPAATAAPQFPVIADPVVERLVQESRGLKMDGDMMRSMLKLDEAGRIDPSEPAVIYHKALLFEEMGLLVKAADHYQQVQQMGLKAGMYFKLAANKLTKGMDVAHANRPVISIGPMTTRKGTGPMGAKKADVSITILARPDKPVNPADVHVQIHFYDKVNGGEIKKASSIAQIKSSWGDNKLDWKDAGNEETLRISYTIPEADLADEHLLGRREFYGYVVELLYKGEVIDQQARPRRLHSVHGSKMAPIPSPEDPMPWLPGDNNSLLPSKDGHGYGNNPTLPPLPSR